MDSGLREIPSRSMLTVIENMGLNETAMSSNNLFQPV